MNNEFKIGLSTNLLAGLDPSWDPRSGKTNILVPAEKAAMDTVVVKPVAQGGTWSFIDITLHESALALLDALVPYRVVAPSSFADAPLIGAGALLAGSDGSKTALAALSKAIGVNLANPDLRYALVRLTRPDGSFTHPSAATGILIHARPRTPDPAYGLRSDFVRAAVRTRHESPALQPDDHVLHMDAANKVLKHFAEFGTHYVSAVELGDSLVQVFAMPSEQFSRVKDAYANASNKLSGPGAELFAQFTTNRADGQYGFVSEYGQILSASNSAAFTQSLQKGEWKDSLWSGKDSLFALFNRNAKLAWSGLQARFTDQAAIGIQLAPLSVMYEPKRGMTWQRVFKAAMAQKYRNTIQPNFSVLDTRDFAAMLPEDQPGIVSEIATPSVNLYKTRLDLAGMQLVAAEEVKNFTVLANVLSAGSEAEIPVPGDKVRLFGQVMDMRARAARTIVVRDAAYETLQIACDEFIGALVTRNASGTAYNVIVDGLRFGLKGSGSDAMPFVQADIRGVPPADALPLLTDGMQFSMAFAEAVISDQSGSGTAEIQKFVRSYLAWLARYIPASTNDESLLALRVRALDLAKYAADPAMGSFVPILPFTRYDTLVQSIMNYLDRIRTQIAESNQKLANRRIEERIINVGKTLNKNIIASGKQVGSIIEANAAQQNDLAAFYDGIVTQRKAEADEQQKSIDLLDVDLMRATSDVKAAVEQYKVAVERWETMKWIKFGLDLATDLFSLATLPLIPASAISSVKELGETAQRIQKALNVLNAGSKLYTGADSSITGLKGAQATLDGLDEDRFGDLSKLAWDDMSTKFTEILATGPDVAAAKAALQSAFTTMVARGKAVASAKSSLYAIQRDIYTNQQQKIINQRQADRFAAMRGKLELARVGDLDRDAIDLVGLTGYLSFIQHQMLTILAKAFLQSDRALQYDNLQQATSVMSFSLLKFSAARVQQDVATNRALEQLRPHQAVITRPIEYVIKGIDPLRLTGGNVLSVTITPDAREFLPYVDARVVSVVATVDGVKARADGRYALRLEFDGRPFHDLDTARCRLNFHTPSRDRVYIFDAKDGSPEFADAGASWSVGVSRVTPFSQWNISFPNTEINKDLEFRAGNVTILLSFVLEARIVDPKRALRNALSNRLPAAEADALVDRVYAWRPLPGATADLAAAPLPSQTDLINMAYAQGSVTNNWDVVFNMGLEEINKALKEQYETLKQDPTYKNEIKIESSQKYPGFTGITRLAIHYGYPQMNFSHNTQDTAELNMTILDGTLQECSKADGTDKETCTPPVSTKDETLSASVVLTKLGGEISVDGQQHNVLEVHLDMAQGAFSLSNMKLSDIQKVALNAAIKAHFSENPVKFLINRLDLTNIPTLDALKPKGFLFKTLETPLKKQMLQLFIMTDNRPLFPQSQAFLNNFPEPLPLDIATSMIVRSGLIFKDVLPRSLAVNGWTLAGVDPKDPNAPQKPWSGRFSAASTQGNVDLSPLYRKDGPTSDGRGTTTTSEYNYWVVGGNAVTWPLDGTTLEVQQNGDLKYSGSHKATVSYNEHRETTVDAHGNRSIQRHDESHSTDVSVNVSAVLKISVSGTDRDQSIGIITSAQAVTIDGHLSGGGPCSSEDLQAQVNRQIRAQVPSQIASKLSFPFTAISVFALKNLLFPTKDCISFESCALPGDMLLFGKFK